MLYEQFCMLWIYFWSDNRGISLGSYKSLINILYATLQFYLVISCFRKLKESTTFEGKWKLCKGIQVELAKHCEVTRVLGSRDISKTNADFSMNIYHCQTAAVRQARWKSQQKWCWRDVPKVIKGTCTRAVYAVGTKNHEDWERQQPP